jgi:DNA-binding MarR family transcriptional regulator
MPDRVDERPGDKLDLAAFLPYRLAVLASRVSRRLSMVYQERFGISIAEWRVIAHLAHGERVSVRDIHDCVNLDKPRVSRAVMRLEAAGIVAKSASKADQRLVEISLTAKGWRLYGEIVSLARDYEQDLLSVLSAAERKSLERAFEKLHARLDRDPLAPPRSRLDPVTAGRGGRAKG